MHAVSFDGTPSTSTDIFLRFGMNVLFVFGALYLQPPACLCWILFPEVVDFPHISHNFDIVSGLYIKRRTEARKIIRKQMFVSKHTKNYKAE